MKSHILPQHFFHSSEHRRLSNSQELPPMSRCPSWLEIRLNTTQISMGAILKGCPINTAVSWCSLVAHQGRRSLWALPQTGSILNRLNLSTFLSTLCSLMCPFIQMQGVSALHWDLGPPPHKAMSRGFDRPAWYIQHNVIVSHFKVLSYHHCEDNIT